MGCRETTCLYEQYDCPTDPDDARGGLIRETLVLDVPGPVARSTTSGSRVRVFRSNRPSAGVNRVPTDDETACRPVGSRPLLAPKTTAFVRFSIQIRVLYTEPLRDYCRNGTSVRCRLRSDRAGKRRRSRWPFLPADRVALGDCVRRSLRSPPWPLAVFEVRRTRPSIPSVRRNRSQRGFRRPVNTRSTWPRQPPSRYR